MLHSQHLSSVFKLSLYDIFVQHIFSQTKQCTAKALLSLDLGTTYSISKIYNEDTFMIN